MARAKDSEARGPRRTRSSALARLWQATGKLVEADKHLRHYLACQLGESRASIFISSRCIAVLTPSSFLT